MSTCSTLLAATLLMIASTLGSAASAAELCGKSAARQAFDVEGLKSELMVTALSCGEQDSYNAFVAKFRPDLTGQERDLIAYFKHTYGRHAQTEHDDYITQLANVQSERGLAAGTQFCAQRANMFGEVMALDNASDLGGYAEAKDIAEPAVYETCDAPAASQEHGRVRHIRSTRRIHPRHRH
ncbi:hypothetical protein [Lichenicoccus sp.]|uniref:hypothetical protein n=1 Tax=Lichenicoccus sp. TaxID=2781899 RepID=UPI003D0F4563